MCDININILVSACLKISVQEKVVVLYSVFLTTYNTWLC